MSVLVTEKDLPKDLTVENVVEAAYASELAEVASKITRGLPVMVECDKDLVPYIFVNIRNRLRTAIPPRRCIYLDGRPSPEEAAAPMPTMGLIATMISQLRNAVRGVT